MLERMGIAGELSFTNLGSRAMEDASRKFDKLVTSANHLGTAARNLETMGRPVERGVRDLFGLFTDFEAQMAVVDSKMGVISKGDPAAFEALSNKAKELGASTVYTATEVAQGLEILATAGFDAGEQLATIGGVLDMAAADGLDMARAAEIMSGTLKGMRMDVSEAARVTNTLAFASKETMTDINKLGYAFSYAMPAASSLGVEVEELGALVGMMGDAMLQSGRGGRNLSTMMTKLVKPSKAGQEIFDKMGFTLNKLGPDGKVSLKTIGEALSDVEAGFNRIENPAERLKAKAIVFAQEGVRAFAAWEAGGRDMFEELVKGSKKAQRENLIGEMAKARLNSFKGDMKMLQSAVEGFAIAVSSAFGGRARDAIQGLNKLLSGVVETLNTLGAAVVMDDDIDRLRAKWGDAAVDIAIGIAAGIKFIGDSMDWLKNKVKSMFDGVFGEMNSGGTQMIAMFTTVGVAGLAGLMPVLAVLRLVGMVIGGVIIPVITAAATAFWPLLAIGLVLGGLFLMMREDGDTFGQTMMRVFNGLINLGTTLWTSVLEPIWLGIKDAYTLYFPQFADSVGDAFRAVGTVISEVFGLINSLLGGTGSSLQWLTTEVLGEFITFFQFGLDAITVGLNAISALLGGLAKGWKKILEGDLVGALKAIGTGIADWLIEPLRWVTQQLIKLAMAIPGGDMLVTEGMMEFANGGSFGQAKEKLMADDLDESGGDRMGSYYIPIATAADEAADAKGKKDKKAVADAVANGLDEGAASEYLEAIANNTGRECEPGTTVLKLDGREVGKGVAKRQAELRERLGKNTSPWTKRQAAEQGWIGDGGLS